jgi:gentisate 1,2-dioxygenase
MASMGSSEKSVANGNDPIPASLRQAWREAHMVPLWESPTAHKLDLVRERAFHWPWRVTRPILEQTAAISSPAVVERRVLSLVNPKSKSAEDEATTGTISACLQTLMPGDRARPHRHSMNALRFALEGEGARTIVDGKDCPMHVGDLVITPAWCWHEHTHGGAGPFIWLDVLDVQLHLFLGTDEFEPGPAAKMPAVTDDAVFTWAGIAPCIAPPERAVSPIFRYPWTDAVKALAAAPVGPDRTRRVRYTNPLDGGACMTTLDCYLTQLDASVPTRAFKTSASAVFAVAEGSGTSQIGDVRVDWKPKDVFTVPQGVWATHTADAGGARLFMVTNRDVMRRLELLREAHAE